MEPLEQSLKYQQYESNLRENGLAVQRIAERDVTRKHTGEVLFALVQVQANTPEGATLPPIALLRGVFVSVLTCLQEAETGQRYLLLVKQRRVATGGWFWEHPAGMADSDTDPYTVALKELHEETGLTATRNELHLLAPHPLFTSPGLMDESGWLFYIERTLPAAEIRVLQAQQHGEASEHEHILLEVVPFEQTLQYLRNVPGVLQVVLYAQLHGLPVPAMG
jgi:8-oxo-dGTP pyrophosphatase MutT (NUDIX family)